MFCASVWVFPISLSYKNLMFGLTDLGIILLWQHALPKLISHSAALPLSLLWRQREGSALQSKQPAESLQRVHIFALPKATNRSHSVCKLTSRADDPFTCVYLSRYIMFHC